MVGGVYVAHLKNFPVNEIGDFSAAGGKAEAAFEAVQRGDFLIILSKQVEALEPGRTGLRAVAFDGDRCVSAKNARGVKEGAAFECSAGGTVGDGGVAEGKKLAGLDGFGEVDDGV